MMIFLAVSRNTAITVLYSVSLEMAALENLESFIRGKVEDERWTHKKLSEYLKASYPQTTKGFSVRSIERFCHEKKIHKTSRLCSTDLDTAISDAIAKVCDISCVYLLV